MHARTVGVPTLSLRTLAERLWKAQERSFIIKLLVAAGTIAGSIAAVVGLVVSIAHFMSPDEKVAYSQEYESLRQLNLGVRVQFLTDRLGQPSDSTTAIRTERDFSPFSSYVATVEAPRETTTNSHRFQLFRYPQRGYVLSALVDFEGRVVGLAVTTCTADFHGAFRTPVGDVVLNKTKMADLGKPADVGYTVGGSARHGYFVLDLYDGDFNAYGYTDTIAGQFYLCIPGPDIPSIFGPIQQASDVTSYKPSLDEHRREWEITAAFIVESGLPQGILPQFVHFAEEGLGFEQ